MSPRRTLILANFFAASHFFLVIYIITPYLATFLPDSTTGLTVSLGAVITLSVFPFMPDLIRKYGTRRLAKWFAYFEIFFLAWLTVSPSPVAAFVLISCVLAITPLLVYQLDLLLEATIAQEGRTGEVRSLFLTAGNVAVVAAPLVAGLLLDGTEDYARVFALAGASLFPFLLLISFKCIPEGESPKLATITQIAYTLMCDKDLRGIVLSHFILQLFYHTAPIYIPLYLHHVLGIPWGVLGWMLMIMLLPFILLEYPAGWLADKMWGDKEMLLVGFVIMGVGFAALAFITENTVILVITLLLVINRIGASLVEAMTEGHFFRKVSEADVSAVGLFRITRPLAALIGPILASIVLAFAGYQVMFIVVGVIITVLGLIVGSQITDIVIPRKEAQSDPAQEQEALPAATL